MAVYVQVPTDVAEDLDKVLLYLEAEMATTPHEQEAETFDAAVTVRRWFDETFKGVEFVD